MKACRYCTKREVGCHDRCIEYLKDKAKLELTKKKARDEAVTYLTHINFNKKTNSTAKGG